MNLFTLTLHMCNYTTIYTLSNHPIFYYWPRISLIDIQYTLKHTKTVEVFHSILKIKKHWSNVSTPWSHTWGWIMACWWLHHTHNSSNPHIVNPPATQQQKAFTIYLINGNKLILILNKRQQPTQRITLCLTVGLSDLKERTIRVAKSENWVEWSDSWDVEAFSSLYGGD